MDRPSVSKEPSDSRPSGGAWRLGCACLLSLLLSGCNFSQWIHNDLKVGPEYLFPPNTAVAEQWIDQSHARLDADLPPHVDWWSALGDPRLAELIDAAYEQNLTLREAGWRVMQARARRDITAGNIFPQTQQAFGDYLRVQNSRNVALPAPLTSFDDWSTGFNLSWELDVWGRFRRAIASADAQFEASVDDYDAILVCLIAEVALAYTDYRTFEHRLTYARNNVQIQEASLKLTLERAKSGKTGYTSVHLAKSSLESTRAGIPNLETGLREANNRLCTLLGLPTQDLQELLGEGDIPRIPEKIGVGIPADLLRRRPDIRAAERAVAAQSEQIGIALSDLYPHFSINGQIVVESERLKDLFSSGSSSGLINPSFRWNLLNYGRIINNVRLQGYGLEELITNYKNRVLTANQEVEDALVAFINSIDRVGHLESAEQETKEALRLLTISFEEGEISFTGVFLLQTTLVVQQDELAAARGDVVINLIRVYKALGGGWEYRCGTVQTVEDDENGLELFEEVPVPAESEDLPVPSGQPVMPNPETEGVQE